MCTLPHEYLGQRPNGMHVTHVRHQLVQLRPGVGRLRRRGRDALGDRLRRAVQRLAQGQDGVVGAVELRLGDLLQRQIDRPEHLRQDVLAETLHIVENRVGGIAAEAEIDRDDAEIAQRPEIGGNRSVVAGAEPAAAYGS